MSDYLLGTDVLIGSVKPDKKKIDKKKLNKNDLSKKDKKGPTEKTDKKLNKKRDLASGMSLKVGDVDKVKAKQVLARGQASLTKLRNSLQKADEKKAKLKSAGKGVTNLTSVISRAQTALNRAVFSNKKLADEIKGDVVLGEKGNEKDRRDYERERAYGIIRRRIALAESDLNDVENLTNELDATNEDLAGGVSSPAGTGTGGTSGDTSTSPGSDVSEENVDWGDAPQADGEEDPFAAAAAMQEDTQEEIYFEEEAPMPQMAMSFVPTARPLPKPTPTDEESTEEKKEEKPEETTSTSTSISTLATAGAGLSQCGADGGSLLLIALLCIIILTFFLAAKDEPK